MSSAVLQTERIDILDSLRGIAVLGILLMNMQGFGLPGPVGYDPSILGESGLNFKVWFFVDFFPEGTQRAIFSMLFGAGIILFTTRQEAKVSGVRSADFFLRRQAWLLVFGLLNIYLLLWPGDILFYYACYGFIAFIFRGLSPKILIVCAVVSLLLMTARENLDVYRIKQVINRGERIQKIDTTKTKLTTIQTDQLGEMTTLKDESTIESKQKRTKKAITKTTGSYSDVYKFRTDGYVNYALVTYGYFGVWDVLLFLFLGMAFYKMGILTGKGSNKLYWAMAIIGLGVGLSISWFRLHALMDNKFNYFSLMKSTVIDTYTISRALRSLGILGVIMLLYKSGWINWFFRLMRPVGQMAFTNYLTQSLICAIIFYGGIGFGLYGKLERVEAYYVVLAIWVVQIIWSHIWLRYFYFGPLEWVWRSLTYWKRQPMRRVAVS